MSTPIGAVLRDATTLNHFYPDLKPTLELLFARYNEEQTWQKELFRQETIDGAYYTLHVWLSPPNPMPFPRGMPLRAKGFGELTMQVPVEDFTTNFMEWHVNDLADSRAPRSLRAQVDIGVKRLMNYKDFVYPELLTGTASTYLPAGFSFGTIFGSTGAFSSSHTYNGQTWDNSVGGSGTSAQALIDDLWVMIKTFQGAVDSEGNPYYPAEEVENARYTIIIPKEMLQPFAQALKSEMILEGGATASSSNYTKTSFGAQLQVKVAQRLTDTNNWYVARTDINMKDRLFGEGVRQDVEVQQWTQANSDYSRENRQEAIRGIRRIAYCVGNPLTGMEFTN